MNMALPFQCLKAYRRSVKGKEETLLIGASGSRLVVVESSSGQGSTWPAEEEASKETEAPAEDEERPGKRIKLTPTNTNDSNSNKSNFSCLALSNDQQYIVAITGEDKCVRVFHIDSDYRIHQLSQRPMARRPCAITLTSDDSTILCADKFGDVYALPLLMSPDDGVQDQEVPPTTSTAEQPETPVEFKPSASVLTVHSGRNRKVLEEQIRQASLGQRKSKEPLKFKHELLLGHVSMLTDIVYANVNGRGYIVTSDRDEHVRVSRAPPQAHIIEGFCHGHEEFVNRLCLVSSGRLVSGGGDAQLFVWDWLNYRLLTTIDVRDAVLRFLKSQAELSSIVPANEEGFKVAVTGIWNVPRSDAQRDEILVTCEGVPAIFHFGFDEAGKKHEQAIPLNGNAIDVTVIQQSPDSCVAVASVDYVHKPGSLKDPREQKQDDQAIPTFTSGPDGQWQADSTLDTAAGFLTKQLSTAVGAAGLAGEVDLKAIQGLLYGTANLRKQPGTDPDQVA
ncbi:guanine-N(7)--methyltransferase subunit TRM82 [Aaosphaeria arxii CBS 175.79]|uniref:Guanine-N(7)--methyltransferase subunit TRM82 n=1 Tax=Aaosphaeria arxii CBS 175.79 TaxID=1450172 RepID=A0A6A5XJ26_9PLEO|nr:guanine-N(7)--methyltransferase subunit TRM82 [Aaosphaeria arxii CBS 175.79]KAF2013275.1 guanine-N(7)--methyltransferase subunit TRM82 [Aaosphaeria arxii CBS 175.79]